MRFGALVFLALAATHAAAQGPQELFERAMQARSRGDLHEAIRSFHAILDEHPGLNRARLELAVAYYHALDHRAALEHARRVLADPATPPAVRENVERLIARIEAEARPHRFSGFASAGWLHDSNVSAGPASPSYEVGGSLLSLDPNAVRRSDNALQLTLGGSHRYLSEWRPGIGGRDGALLWQSSAQYSRVDYRHENAYDLDVLTLTTGPAWISPPRLRALAPLQYDRLELGDEHYLDILGVSPSLVLGNVAGVELTADTQLQERSYQRSIDAGRDSRYHALGLQGGIVVSGITLQAGARASRDNADDAQWDYRGTEWSALVAGKPLEAVTAYLRLTWQRNRYDQPDPIAAAGRTDRETRYALGASYRYADWSASLTLLDIEHRSSVTFYAFERRQLSATLTKDF